MIDVHVLTHSKTRDEWLDKCLDSLRGQPCVVHVIKGDERNISAGRVRGFSAGSHEFVSFVDSDDYVLPGVFDMVLERLHHGDDAVATGESIVRDGVEVGRQVGHHLFAIRRSVLAPFLPKWDTPSTRFMHCIDKLRSVAKPTIIDKAMYVWRLHGGQSHRHLGAWAQTEHMRATWQHHRTSSYKRCQTEAQDGSFFTDTQIQV